MFQLQVGEEWDQGTIFYISLYKLTSHFKLIHMMRLSQNMGTFQKCKTWPPREGVRVKPRRTVPRLQHLENMWYGGIHALRVKGKQENSNGCV